MVELRELGGRPIEFRLASRGSRGVTMVTSLERVNESKPVGA